MALEIFKLVGSIYVDNEKANESIAKTDEKAGNLGNKFLSGIGTAAKWGASIAAGAAAGAAALYGMATKAAAATDNIDKMSQKIGISRQAYQELDFICSQSGTSVDNLKAGMKTLTNQMQSAASGSATATAAFESLGLSWTDNTGALKDQEMMMWEAMDALQNCSNETEKAALATDLFGKAGTELMPLLNSGSGSIEEMRQKAHELGLVLSDDAVDAGVQFTDMVDQIKRSFSAVVTQVGVSVMPIIVELGEMILTNMPAIQNAVQTTFNVISEVVTAVGGILGELIGVIKSVVSECQTEGTVFSKIWTDAQAVFEAVIKVIQDVFAVFSAAFSGDWETFWSGIGTLFADIVNALGSVLQLALEALIVILGSMVEGIKNAARALFENIKSGFEAVWSDIKMWFDTQITNLQKALSNKATAFKNVGKKIFTSLWDGLKEVWSNVTAWVNNTIDWLKDKLTFWDNASSSMSASSVDGSHAGGLDSVPYDGYIARLHKNERVLTASENTSLENMMSAISSAMLMGGNSDSSNNPIIINLTVDGKNLAKAVYDPLQSMAKQKGALA